MKFGLFHTVRLPVSGVHGRLGGDAADCEPCLTRPGKNTAPTRPPASAEIAIASAG